MTTHAQRVQPQGYQPSATQKQKKKHAPAGSCKLHTPRPHDPLRS